MFKVQLFESPPGINQLWLVQDTVAKTLNRDDAVTFVETYISAYAEFDYDARGDRWWCRNRGDKVIRILLITSTDSDWVDTENAPSSMTQTPALR